MAKRTFDDWIDGIFDHPVNRKAWYFGPHADTCLEDAGTNVAYLTTLFLDSRRVLGRFDDAQVNQGLWMIASGSCSDHAFTILGDAVPWADRRPALAAMATLYADCFAVRCDERLSHLDEPANPVNGVCYMWWDVLPAWGDPNDRRWAREGQACLSVMEQCLNIEHVACQEGALHGLGHFAALFPDRVAAVVDRFVEQHPNARPELLDYARSARDGGVQ